MTVEVGFLFRGPDGQRELRGVRQWMLKNEGALGKWGIPAQDPFTSAEEALTWRAERPSDRLLVTLGFARREIESNSGAMGISGEPIVMREFEACGAVQGGSASFIDQEPIIVCDDVIRQIRKSLIRMTLRKKGLTIQNPKSEKQWSQYFALRYRVWDKMGYLREENRQTQTEWELDYWDRTAVPWCAIRRDGDVVGCVRLMRSHGKEQKSYVETIRLLLESCGDPELRKLFEFPKSLKQPFDLLEEFQEFRPYFRPLIQSKTSLAEVGRVIVDDAHRRLGLAEALVDTALSCAQAKGVARVFLACEVKLAGLYANCGFRSIEGLRSEKFFNIPRPSMVMERWIQAESNQVAA